jgi:hypothetical protein
MISADSCAHYHGAIVIAGATSNIQTQARPWQRPLCPRTQQNVGYTAGHIFSPFTSLRQ